MSGRHGRVIFFFAFSSVRFKLKGEGTELGRASGQAQLGCCAFCVGSTALFLINTGWDRFFFSPVWEDFGGTAATFGGPERRAVSPNCKAPSGSVGSRSLLPYGDLSAVGSPSCKQMCRFLADVLASRSPVAVSLGRKKPPSPSPPPPGAAWRKFQIQLLVHDVWRRFVPRFFFFGCASNDRKTHCFLLISLKSPKLFIMLAAEQRSMIIPLTGFLCFC